MNKNILKYALLALMLVLSLTFAYFVSSVSEVYSYKDFIYSFLLSACLWTIVVLLIKSSLHKIAYIFSFILSLLYIVGALTYSYYHKFDIFVSNSDLLSIIQSTKEQTLDYLFHYILNFENILAIVLFSLVVFLLTKVIKFYIKKRSKNIKIKIILSISSLAFSLFFFLNLSMVSSYIELYQNERSLIKDFDLNQKEHENKMAKAYKDQKGEFYILVISDNVNRDLMGVYTHVVEDTPFLSKLHDKNQIVIKNAYVPFSNGRESLFLGLSQSNLYKPMSLTKGENLISLAKKAGFKTYWYSNQERQSKYSNKITALANLCDETYFTDDSSFENFLSKRPDKVLFNKLKELESRLSRHENNLLIIHLMGSTPPYDHRYNDSFEKFDLTYPDIVGDLANRDNIISMFKPYSYLDKYLNSIKYTDYLLTDIYNLFRMRIDYRALIYMSASGDNVQDKEKNVAFDYKKVRVPLIFLVSDFYKNQYEDSFNNLTLNKDKVVTLDTLYDLMLSFMHIHSDYINEDYAITNKNYNLSLDKFFINDKYKVQDDGDFIAFNNAKNYKNLVIKSANSSFKSNFVSSIGYNALHVNALIYEDKIYVKNTSDLTYTTLLEDYISNLKKKHGDILLEFDDTFNVNIIVNSLTTLLNKDRLVVITKNFENARFLYEQNIKSIVNIDNISILNNVQNKNDYSVLLNMDSFDLDMENILTKFKSVYFKLNNKDAKDKDLKSFFKLNLSNVYYLIDYKTPYDSNFNI